MELKPGQTLTDLVGLPILVSDTDHPKFGHFGRIIHIQDHETHPLLCKFDTRNRIIYGLKLESVHIRSEKDFLIWNLTRDLQDAHPQVWLNTYADLLQRQWPYDLTEDEDMKWSYQNLCKEYLYTYQFPKGGNR